MKLSTRSRYGLRTMYELASVYGDRQMMLKEIAAGEDISEKYLSLLMIPLKAAGLVQAVRGAHGGYSLSRSPERITVLEIVEVLEGQLKPVECGDEEEACVRAGSCVARLVWEDLGNSIRNTLKKYTLADLLDMGSKMEKTSVNFSI